MSQSHMSNNENNRQSKNDIPHSLQALSKEQAKTLLNQFSLASLENKVLNKDDIIDIHNTCILFISPKKILQLFSL